MSVSGTSDALSASLFADEYCGEGTSLIHYIKLGSVVSRAFTSKDTHSPHGDLLVVYGKENTAHHGVLAGRTAAVLGFEAPSFTTGTDLILPVEANADLRAALAAGGDAAAALAAINGVLKLGDLSAVPQVRVWGCGCHLGRPRHKRRIAYDQVTVNPLGGTTSGMLLSFPCVRTEKRVVRRMTHE